ncbi:hypothetical protein ACQKMK_13110 [Viridibacillus arvi]|uniref:hypothetical protein n=1 Tax=Viridibacillus arvi TaxID=263475 RepID=UPI003D022C28
MKKDDIQGKMLNSIDYYNKVKGSFVINNKSSNSNVEIEYFVDTIKNNSKSVGVLEGSYIELVHNGSSNTRLEIDKTNKVFKVNKTVSPEDLSDLDENESDKSVKSRYEYSSDGVVYVFRNDPTYMGIASESLFPQETALWYLEDQSLWSIKKRTENILGREVVVIDGEFEDYYVKNRGATSYKLWVDTKTGILLQLEEYSNKEIINSLYTKSIEVDRKKFSKTNLNENIFNVTPPKGYKEITLE